MQIIYPRELNRIVYDIWFSKESIYRIKILLYVHVYKEQ